MRAGTKILQGSGLLFKSVAETSEKVPELKHAVTAGELTLSQARRIVPVTTPENQDHWIDQAKSLSQTDLEKEVTASNPQARPREKIKPFAKNLSELRVPIDDETEHDLLALKNIVSQKLGRPATMSDVIAFAAKETRSKYDPEQKAKRSKPVSSGNRPIPSQGRHVISNRVKSAVILKKGFQCYYVGRDGMRCQQKTWLHFHHIKSVAKGGLNTPDNLRLYCSQHHAAIHDQRITPTESDQVQQFFPENG